MGAGLKPFCLTIYFFFLQIHSSRRWQHAQNLSFLMRLSLLIVPLVVMITHKHLHSKEPYSVWTETNTLGDYLSLASIADNHWGGLMWQYVSRGRTDVASSTLTNTQSTCEVSSLFYEQEVPVGRPSHGSVTSHCKGFLNPPSCWYEYFHISFLQGNQLFLSMH